MIRHTHAAHPQGTVKAYSDNAGVIEGFDVSVFGPDEDFRYGYRQRQTHVLIKVETHNHPTAIAPYPGASTGVGGKSATRERLVPAAGRRRACVPFSLRICACLSLPSRGKKNALLSRVAWLLPSPL